MYSGEIRPSEDLAQDTFRRSEPGVVLVRSREISTVSGWIEARKLRVYLRCPYRKPTQVGRKKILRPTGEGLLRNSAS
jgi:hypothetical protein